MLAAKQNFNFDWNGREIRMKVLELLFIWNLPLIITGKNAGKIPKFTPTVIPTTTAPLYTQVKPERKFVAPRSTTTAPHARTMFRTPRTDQTTTRTTITSPTPTTTRTTTAVTNTSANTTDGNVTITYTTDLSSTSLLNTISNVIQTTGIV